MTNTGGSMDWESKSVLGKHIRVLVVKKQTKKSWDWNYQLNPLNRYDPSYWSDSSDNKMLLFSAVSSGQMCIAPPAAASCYGPRIKQSQKRGIT